MAIHSMTGFGRATVTSNTARVTVDISSVNRKQMDVRIHLPRELAELEPRLQKQLGAAISRGGLHVTVSVVWTGTSARGGQAHIDMPRARAYVDALRQTGKALNLQGDVSLESLLRLPDLIVYENAARRADRVWPTLQNAFRTALGQLLDMRRAEGLSLEADIRKRFKRLRTRSRQVAQRAPMVVRKHRKELEKRIADMQLNEKPDATIIAREVALFADRSDITEELVRLKSHLDQADQLITKKTPAGRPFDFLCQEILREINTIGSKANDAKLTVHVIEMKSELERIREQVQNIE